MSFRGIEDQHPVLEMRPQVKEILSGRHQGEGCLLEEVGHPVEADHLAEEHLAAAWVEEPRLGS